MGRRKKWTNEEMWNQAADWAKNGSSYREIAGRLAQDKWMRQFELSEPPGEDTIRREVKLRSCTNGLAEQALGTDRINVRSDDLVYQQARLRHVTTLGEVAMDVLAQLALPPAYDAGSQMLRAKYNPKGWNPPIISGEWNLDNQAPGTLSLKVEKASYFSSLKNHVPDDALWMKLLLWKTKGAEYLWACRQLAEAIVEDAKAVTNCPLLLTDADWPQQGITYNFPRQIYWNAASTACGLPGTGLLQYYYGQIADRVNPSRQVWILSVASEGIAAHPDKSALEPARAGRTTYRLLPRIAAHPDKSALEQ